MSFIRTTDAATEPLTTAEAKEHLKVEHDAEDTYIDALVQGARRLAEHKTTRALITQTWTLKLDGFSDGRYLRCDKFGPYIAPAIAPLIAVSSITYLDADGDSQTVDAADYKVDASSVPGRIYTAYDKSWPTVRGVRDSVTVTLTAGYGAASAVPEGFKHWIRLQIGAWHEERAAVVAGVSLTKLPPTVCDHLLDEFMWPEFR